MYRRLIASLVVSVVLTTLVGAQPARAATTWIWPDVNAPCNTTLQACITNALGGDTVLVAQSGAINEQVSIVNKSLTLAAQAGFEPVLDIGIIQNSGANGMPLVNVTVSHIGFSQFVQVYLDKGAGHTITLDHISAVSSGASPGVYSTIYVASTVNVLYSTITVGGFHPGIKLISPTSHADLNYNVIGNTVTGHGQTDAQTGIYLDATVADSLTVNAYNNVIWDVGVGTSASASAGFFLDARDSGDADFNIVGNTISRVHDGIKVNNEQHAPNHLSLDVFDNIIQGTEGSAVHLTHVSDGPYIVRGGYNDFSANGSPNQTEGQSLGTNLTVRPKFVSRSTGDLRLKPSSPLIDQGLVCTHGGIAGPDADGLNRLQGPTVDIGAYESGAGQPGVVLIGTSGPDILVGTPQKDILCGYGGDDTLEGLDARDFLDGGKGDDKLYGGTAPDRLFGRGGKDLLCADDGSGGDHLDGGAGTDSYRADPGDVRISVEKLGDCTPPV